MGGPQAHVNSFAGAANDSASGVQRDAAEFLCQSRVAARPFRKLPRAVIRPSWTVPVRSIVATREPSAFSLCISILGKYIVDKHVCLVYDLSMETPKSLQEAIVYFSDPERAFEYTVNLRWPNGKVTCPRCGGEKHSFIKGYRRWFCYVCKKQFTLKVGTVFEDSPIGLDKWMMAFWMLTNCKNGVSSCEIAKDVKVTQKTAWFMLHRIRTAMQDEFYGKRLGSGPESEVEVDESFIGGKARNMHVSERQRRITGTGGKDKTAVLGILERGGKIRTKVIPSRRKRVLQDEVRKHVTA